jgi:toxin ParE1/3/4
VAEYRISVRARANILDIYRYGDETFGRYEAEAYSAGLEKSFGLLADFPKAGASAAELIPGLRRLRFQSHVIYFSADGDFVLIRAVLHVRQTPRAELFE